MPALDRRALLVGGGVGIGLVVAYALWPSGLASDLATTKGEERFGAFIKIARGGRITVAIPQVETGQGVWTALPQIVADELGAAWETIAVEPAPLTAAYGNPLASSEGWLDGLGALRTHRLIDQGETRITAGSTSVRAFEGPLRSAAAVARAMLVGAAADRWGVAAGECQTADGLVLNNGRSFPFGELAEEAASRSAPGSAPMRTDRKGRLIGRSLPRLDGPAKANGSLRFAADVRLPDLLFASARLAPPGGKLDGYSTASLRVGDGIRHVEAGDQWIAVVAERWDLAERALAAANPRFTAPAAPADPRPLFEAALRSSKPEILLEAGDFDSAAQGLRPLATTYYAAPSQHLSLEPVSATARWTNGTLELWSAAQAPSFGRALAAEGGGGGLGSTALYPMPVGAPSGQALENPAAPIAIVLAKILKRPVQVTLPHHVSRNVAPLSPGALAQMAALVDSDGTPVGWRMRVASADGMTATISRLGGEESAASVPDYRGTLVAPYAMASVAVSAVAPDLPYAIGYMRGSPQRELAFCVESFIDEIAHRIGQEPLALRMRLLGGNPRLARCLQSAAARAGWDGGGNGSNMGIAGCSAFGSHIALVATASISPELGVRVEKLVASVDCGRVINRGLAAQQVEAGLLWAVAQAVIPAPIFVGSMAKGLGTAGMPRIADTPEIIVEFIASSEGPGGLSGLGTLPLAPAVANALHAATGKRMRNLPFDPMGSA